MLGPASSLQRNGPRSLSRNIFAIFSALALVLGFALTTAPSAHAAITCTNLSPAIGEVVTCTGAGAASINIPTGARGVRIVAVGGGGQGGERVGPDDGANGGAGARVDGTFALSGGGTLSAQVGAGGAGGNPGGAGGAFSRVQLGGTDLAIAGGGGGGAFGVAAGIGGSGAASGTAAGGDGEDSGGSTGGKGGSAGAGGLAGTGTTPGAAGSDYPDGAGGSGGGSSGGYGGAGYGGGGGGGSGTIPNITGGGAGGSFANPTLLVGTASFSPSAGVVGSGEPGSGGTGETATIPRANGAAGLIQITFLDTLPGSSQVPPPILQQFGLPADGECESGATQEMNWAGVESGGWGKSWAQWMNDGTGGAVCTRTLIYNPARARWMVEGT